MWQGQLAEKFAAIPEGVDLLLTHTPPRIRHEKVDVSIDRNSPHFGSVELLDALRGRCRLFAVTNGVVTTQLPRLERSGLNACFEQVFISEAMGCKKPEPEFFDKCFAAMGPVDKSRCMLLGDSLTSDMQGGRNAGIATCLLGKPTDDPRCDYVIQDLLELLPLLD